MIKFIDNPTLCKIITLCIFLIFAFVFLFVSSFKTVLNCENGSCTVKTVHMFSEGQPKVITLAGNDFYCTEEHKLKSKRKGGHKHVYTWNLKLHGEKIFEFDYKDGCYGELNSVYQNLHENNKYSNTYERFSINILCKILAAVFGFLAFMTLIGKVSPIEIGIESEENQVDSPPYE